MSPQPLLIEAPPLRDYLAMDDDSEVLHVEQIAKALFRLTLTRSNRADIFSSVASRLERNKEEAELLLGNLQRWAPGEIAGSFVRRTAAAFLDNTPFRVVCSSERGVPFDSGFQIRQYLAVSYCWHSDEWPSPASPDDELGLGIGRYRDDVTHPWPIFERFAEAVLHERGHPREGIWMDQLCINQSDEAEQQRAIAAMDIIYKSCRKLVVLLEDVDLTEDEVKLSVKYDLSRAQYEKTKGPVPLDKADLPVFFSFLHKVGRARWWQRTWCFHEYVVVEPWTDERHHLDRNTVFIMGSPGGGTVSISFITVQRILIDAIQYQPYDQPILPGLTPYLAGLSNDVSPYKDERIRKAGSMRASVSAQYNAVASTGCKIATDRLAVMINLNGFSIAYTGRDITKEEVYFFGVALALAAGEESPLSYISSQDLILHDRPSWVSRSPEDVTLPRFTLKTLPGIHHISMHALELDMIFFDSPLHEPTKEEIDATKQIFPNLICSTPLPWRMDVNADRQRYYTDEQLDSVRRAFLATAMGLQSACLRRLWTVIYRDIVQVKFDVGMFNALKPNPALLDKALEFLSRIPTSAPPSPPNSGEGKEDREKQSFDLNAALFFLTWFTDPRMFLYLGLFPFRVQCATTGAQALISNITTNSHFSFSNINKIRAAIPTALVGSSCLQLKVWLLQPVEMMGDDGDVVSDSTGGEDVTGTPRRWRVVGKAMLLGEPDLNAELESYSDGDDGKKETVLTLKRNQVIVG